MRTCTAGESNDKLNKHIYMKTEKKPAKHNKSTNEPTKNDWTAMISATATGEARQQRQN